MDAESNTEPGYIEQAAMNTATHISEAAEHAAKGWGHFLDQQSHEDAATRAFAQGDLSTTDVHVHAAVVSMTESEHEWTAAGRALGLDVDGTQAASNPESTDTEVEHEASTDVDGEY